MMLQKTLWLIFFCIGFAIADKWGEIKVSRLESTHAKQQAAAETAARQRLESAQAQGDRLSARLSDTESALNKKTLEVSREVARLTTGRPCLDGRVVGLLNRPAPNAGPLPQAAVAPDAADGTVATDTDVAGWIGNAKGQYATCRARLAALIDFEEGKQ